MFQPLSSCRQTIIHSILYDIYLHSHAKVQILRWRPQDCSPVKNISMFQPFVTIRWRPLQPANSCFSLQASIFSNITLKSAFETSQAESRGSTAAFQFQMSRFCFSSKSTSFNNVQRCRFKRQPTGLSFCGSFLPVYFSMVNGLQRAEEIKSKERCRRIWSRLWLYQTCCRGGEWEG